ncbi:MAG: DUF305 domain-containing protein [Candidatus Saccharimonadales bacterium]|jgi:uncharacterized protein (DUF305 family)|nr:hypothetical protein [Patescibacteria group bacterium]
METKSLLFGLVGFFLGGLIVSVAATSMTPAQEDLASSDITMNHMTEMLDELKGDKFDAAFVSFMIDHHQSAVDMARLSESRAKRDEIKNLSREIITTQKKEITQMKQWQTDWNLPAPDHSTMMH